MITGLRTLGALAFGETPDEFDLSEPSLFAELLKDPDAQFINLIEIMPYDENLSNEGSSPEPLGSVAFGEFGFNFNGGERTRYFSDVGFCTEPSDTPANTTYLALTSNALQFDVTILSGEQFESGSPTFGSIRILNGDAELDDMVDYYFGGRSVQVLAGTKELTRQQFEVVFNGLMTQPEFDENEIILNISDKSIIFDTEFEQNLYEGTGGLEGGDDLEGTVKPVVYGQCLNISPVLVDAGNLVYQIHDGTMSSVDAVYDKGVALTDGGDVADITIATPSAGQFVTQLSGGYIKLGSTPSGRITADFKGDASGSGYVNKSGDIAERIITTKLGSKSLSSAEVDSGALNALDNTIDGIIGLYLTDRTTALDILNSVINPVQAYWTFTRQGLFTVGVIDNPSASAVYTIGEDQIVSYECLRVINPSWRLTVGYAQNWTAQTLDDVAAAATDDYKTFIEEQFRTIVSEERNVRTKSASATERRFNTLLLNEADALQELTRIKRLYGVQRKVYRLEVKNLLYRVYIGDVIQLNTNRFSLSSGKNFIITAVGEDAETSTTILEVWG